MAKKKIQYNDRNEIMELISAITNVAHAEYHICETLQANLEDAKSAGHLSEYLQSIRSIRIALMTNLMKKRPAVKGLWCVFKHLFLALFSLYELMEKEVCDGVIITQAQKLNDTIDNLLAHDEFKDLKGCVRCSDESSN